MKSPPQWWIETPRTAQSSGNLRYHGWRRLPLAREEGMVPPIRETALEFCTRYPGSSNRVNLSIPNPTLRVLTEARDHVLG
jgi:hypothetical protein